jgi:hypothetical protein
MKPQERDQLLQTLADRFEQNIYRHPRVAWSKVLSRLEGSPGAVKALREMEATGGEPDVIGRVDGQFIFSDCSPESPMGRRSLCYDKDALDSRKENKPAGSVMQMAAAMGVKLPTEEQYRALQELGEFDTKTSSWIATPEEIRARGGALFGDRRYGRVFVYHNGAQSYYAARGFRAFLFV